MKSSIRTAQVRRRTLLAAAGAASTVPAGAGAASAAPATVHRDQNADDLVLVNGRIHTFDARNTIVRELRISGGRIVALGKRVDRRGACVVELDGRSAYPGIVDNHVHFLRLGNLPGRTVRELERCFTVRAACAAIGARAGRVPAGALLTLLGGITTGQFAEQRFPNLGELDRAAPRHSVYISQAGSGPGQTNSAGRALLRGLGVPVAEDGTVPAGAPTDLAYARLAETMTDEDRQRQLRDEVAYAHRLGLTTVHDMSGTVPGVGYLDPATGYDPYLYLVRDGEMPLRTRLFLPGRDDATDLATLREVLDNRWREIAIGPGGDLHRVVGIGEWATGRLAFADPDGDVNRAATVEIARRAGRGAGDGWIYHQHVITTAEIQAHLDLWEDISRTYPLRGRRWSLGHLDGITPAQVDQANRLGVGLAVHPWRYLGGTSLPPLRMVLDRATVPVGGGSDGARISPLNPWAMIYAAVTGRNNASELVNEGQTVSRLEALRLWAGPGQGWFSREDGLLGGLQLGGYADLMVPNADPLDPGEVPDGQLRLVTSDLTVIDGTIVHDTGALRKH